MMILCEKCGKLSFYDPYFKQCVCNSCGHREEPRPETKGIYIKAIPKRKKESDLLPKYAE